MKSNEWEEPRAMWSPAASRPMRTCKLMRTVQAGTLTIRLWIDAEAADCGESEERADELALCAATLADEDDDPVMLADKLATLLQGLSAVVVTDEAGNGGVIYP